MNPPNRQIISTPRVAIVHHWIVRKRGGERVLESLCRAFPQADLFTLVYDPNLSSPIIKEHRITTSWIQKLPFATKRYSEYLPLFPLAVEQFDLSDYDLVISSDANLVKGVLTRPETCHICYCHSPLRYAWSAFHTYLDSMPPWKRGLASIILNYLRLWDLCAAHRVDYFVANSWNVARRIDKYYRRSADVIYPPITLSKSTSTSGTFFLAVGHFAPYKRFDIAVDAFNELGLPLWIVGEGPEARRLKQRALSNIRFLDRVSDSELANLLSSCRALVFPGEEDFGMIVPEAHACGRPVIALGKGGALETVIPNVNGILFAEPSAASLKLAVLLFEQRETQWNSDEIRETAEAFKEDRFIKQFSDYAQGKLIEHQGRFKDNPRPWGMSRNSNGKFHAAAIRVPPDHR